MTCCLEQKLPPDSSPSLESLEGHCGSSDCHKETRLLPDVPEYNHWIPLPQVFIEYRMVLLPWLERLPAPHLKRCPRPSWPWCAMTSAQKPHCREAEREISSSGGFSLLRNFNSGKGMV